MEGSGFDKPKRKSLSGPDAVFFTDDSIRYISSLVIGLQVKEDGSDLRGGGEYEESAEILE